MKKVVLGMLILATPMLLVGAKQEEKSKNGPTRAVAVVHGFGESHVKGVVHFMVSDDGVEVRGEITGLTPGKHGFHIHEFGDASSPDGKAAGSHFNPKGMVHGDPSKTGPRHLGDLGNIQADSSGKATYDMVDPDLPLSGPMSIIGNGVVIHEKADDFGQPTGNAGGRLAVAAIGVTKGS